MLLNNMQIRDFPKIKIVLIADTQKKRLKTVYYYLADEKKLNT